MRLNLRSMGPYAYQKARAVLSNSKSGDTLELVVDPCSLGDIKGLAEAEGYRVLEMESEAGWWTLWVRKG